MGGHSSGEFENRGSASDLMTKINGTELGEKSTKQMNHSPVCDCWHLSDDQLTSAALPRCRIRFSETRIWALICWFWGLGSMGRLEGLQGKMSSGDPQINREVLPSPSQFHTSAVGQRRVMVCMMPQSFMTMERCCGQSRYSANTAAKGWVEWYWLLLVVVMALEAVFK